MKNVAYEAVFKQIESKLKNGTVPWRRPWKQVRPVNGKNGRPYNGINFFLLSMADFSDHRWVTYKQITDLGGNVKKGEKSTQVVFWQILSKEEDGKKKSVPLLKYYNVFNAEQTEGIDWDTVKFEDIPNVSADELVEGYADCPAIVYGGDTACYIPSMDKVKMPNKKDFHTIDGYYATLFHELAHSTGHKDRLNRKGITDSDGFGGINYSEEELIAEFSAAFLCNASGIDNTLESSAAYIQSWLKAFRDNPKMIVNAASKAQKAVDYIMGTKSHDEVTA